jgi:hypothetical protein
MLRSLLGKRRGKRREGGQVLVLFELCLIVMLLFVAMVIDLGFLRNNRQILVNTVDAAALAGGSMLPVSGATGSTDSTQVQVETLIKTTIAADYPTLSKSATLSPDAYTITYKCLIGVDSTGQPRTSDVPTACDPHNKLGHNPVLASDFIGAGPTRVSACDPSKGDTCNAVVVEASSTTQYAFAPVGGVNSGSSGTVSSASCKGLCGAPPVVPVDVVIITDRTESMEVCPTPTPIGCTHDTGIKNIQAGANAVLSTFDPNLQRVALGTIGPSQVNSDGTPKTAGCPIDSSGYTANNSIGSVLAVGENFNSTWTAKRNFADESGNTTGNGLDPGAMWTPNFTVPTDLGRWIPVGFTGTDTDTPAVTYHEAYSTGGTVKTTSEIYKAISCEVWYTLGTNLDTPIRMATYYLNSLNNHSRTGVKKAIILETDGAPRTVFNKSAEFTCTGANAAAKAAKDAGIIIYTIGYGLDPNDTSKNCPLVTSDNSNETGSDKNGLSWSGQHGRNLLLNMASDISKFYDSPAGAAVADAFKSAALDIIGGGAHLIQLYPVPVVTYLSSNRGNHQGGGSITINGKYFTGATTVKFGAASANITAITDTAITVVVPRGTKDDTVDVVVTTTGGISSISTGDQYNYNG